MPFLAPSSADTLGQIAGPRQGVTLKHDLESFRAAVSSAFGDPQARSQIEHALELAGKLFGLAERPDGTSQLHHTLRVASTLLITWGIRDSDLVIAALLHDALEDCAGQLAQDSHLSGVPENQAARARLTALFGEPVCALIERVTSPSFIGAARNARQLGDSRGEVAIRAELNQKFVTQAILDSDAAFMIKLADYLDNAGSLERVEDPRRRGNLALKYGALVDVFTSRLGGILEHHPLLQYRHEISSQLERIRTSCSDFSEKEVPSRD